ncbi:MAG: permease prefix domain 1-containing protein, partial [Blastocatellia bacterium]
MTWWHRLLRRKKMEEQLERELRFHIDNYTTDLIAQGVDPEEARRQSLIAVGGREQVKEQCRDARGTRWLEDFLQDFRYGVRTLRRNPGFTAAALLTLALGIGASTAIFSAVNPILFEPLPYPHANRVMMIWYPTDDSHRGMQAFGTYCELAARNRSFEGMAVFKSWQPTMTGPAEP